MTKQTTTNEIKIKTTADQAREIAFAVDTANVKGVKVGKTVTTFSGVTAARETLAQVEAMKENKIADGLGKQTTALSSCIRKISEAIAAAPKAERVAAAPKAPQVIPAKKVAKTSARQAAKAKAAAPKAKAAAKKATAKPKADGDGPVGGHSIARQRGTGSIWVRNTGSKRFLTAISIRGNRRRMLFATQAEAEAWLDEMSAAKAA